MCYKSVLTLAAVLAMTLANPIQTRADGEVINIKAIALGVAQDIAQGAIDACRREGYQVSAVVVDRSAVPQVILRDIYASRFTIDIAQRKANAVILAGVSTREFAANRKDLTPKLNHLDDLLILHGGLPIRVAGAVAGAVGVSGAPGGEIDERCAQHGLDKVRERLEFADF